MIIFNYFKNKNVTYGFEDVALKPKVSRLINAKVFSFIRLLNAAY